MSPSPTKLALDPDGRLSIEWSDGQVRKYRPRELREKCPCATCREKRREDAGPAPLLNVLRPEEARPLGVATMRPVGNYAYNVGFTDGHDTGIFTLEVLRELGEAE